MHEGRVSTELGFKGIPAASESVIVARDLLLAELTGGHYHVAHVSTAEAVQLSARPKREGAPGDVRGGPAPLRADATRPSGASTPTPR